VARAGRKDDLTRDITDDIISPQGRGKDRCALNVGERIAALRGKANNVKSRELQSLAEAAGWSARKQKGKHLTYVKGGRSLPIPTHAGSLKAGTVRRILDRIEEFHETS
jgi:predicted RNA binding protein YcfA (HicA-like mRNA interferase family)